LGLLETQRERIVLIANHVGINTFAPCAAAGKSGELLACVAAPDDAVHTWADDAKREALLGEVLALVDRAPPGSLFIVCAGPLSKPLISAMWGRSKAHQLVDFGSSLDEVLKKKITRPYMDPNSPYSKGVDAQWFCHRGKAAIADFHIYDSDSPASAFADSRCSMFSVPEGE
jgi:hypothetical protein